MNSNYDNQVESMINTINNKNKNNKKQNKKGLFKDPLLKEMKPFLVYLCVLLVLIVVSAQTVFYEDSEYYYKDLLNASKDMRTQSEQLRNTANQIGVNNSKIKELETNIEELQAFLTESNLVRTPLDQSHHLTSYFDLLVDEYNLDLIHMTVDEDSPQPEGLKPINIQFKSDYDTVIKVFTDLYTRRVIYNEDLKITNMLDGSLIVDFVVKFREEGDEYEEDGEIFNSEDDFSS